MKSKHPISLFLILNALLIACAVFFIVSVLKNIYLNIAFQIILCVIMLSVAIADVVFYFKSKD